MSARLSLVPGDVGEPDLSPDLGEHREMRVR